jgi:hypothetical protein
MEDEKFWVYIGKGGFIDGIPARDLTAADWARLNEDERAAVEHSCLYRHAPRPKAEEPPVTEEKPAVEEKPAAAKTAAKQEKDKE